MNKLGRILVVLGGIGLLLVSFASATTGIRQQNRATVSPIESTRQQQTIDAVVREILSGTATAQQQFAVTQTVQAAVNNAISQTLAVESALTKQAVMATTSYESTATVEGAKLARITEIFESTGTAEAVQMARATANFESTGTAQAVQMARATANFEATATTVVEQFATVTANFESTATAEAVLQIIEHASTFTGTRNADWQPFSHVFSDGVERVLVPVGCFRMGSNEGYEDEQPVHEQCVTEPFWLDKYEVTNALYGPASGSSSSSEADQPRTNVTWLDAQAFCEARGGTLPSEMQWEYAARGVESWAYPWGNDYDAERVIGEDDPTYGDTRTAPVGSRPDGASWVGAMDMSGNVWEWTHTRYAPYPYEDGDIGYSSGSISIRVLRGGSFYLPADGLRSADRNGRDLFVGGNNVGFRCIFLLNNSTYNRSMGATDQPQPMGSVEQAIENASTFTGTRNADWQPFSHVFSDGVERVLVPVGCFTMGSNNGEDNEQPVHEQCVTEPFWLDKYEVTNALYGSVGCSNYSLSADQPRNCVDWYDAQAFCEARGGTLPSEMQWEYAARGIVSWEYPWGNDYIKERLIGEDDPSYGDRRTAPVGSRPRGASWVGAMDMSGNVWEWTSTAYRDYPYTQQDEQPNYQYINYVMRGGSFFDPAYFLRTAYRMYSIPAENYNNLGFRCAFSLTSPATMPTVTPTITPTLTVTPTITPTPPFLCRVFVETGQGAVNVNVRTRPDVNSTRIGTLPVGVAADVLELQRDAGGSIWFNVSATIESSATINGWLRSDTVVQVTACPLVP